MNTFLKDKKTLIINILIFALAYITGISLALVSGYGITNIDILVPCLIALSAMVYYKAFSTRRTKQDIIFSIIVGFLFATTLVVGSKVDHVNMSFSDFGIKDVLPYPFLGLFFTSCTKLLFVFRDKLTVTNIPLKAEYNPKGILSWIKKHPFCALFSLNVIGYLPYYLTFFPGNCGADTWESIHMALGDIPWTNHHPVLFTGFFMIIIKLTGFLPLTFSIGIISLLQMISFAAALAYLANCICRMNIPWIIKLVTALFFAFHPFMGMYSIHLTKDVLFAEIIILLCLKIYDITASGGETLKQPKECIILAILFLLSTMLRNNGIYIVLVMAIIFLFLFRKNWKRILIMFLCVISLYYIWYGPVFSAIGIKKQSFAEAASVPLQQVGYVLWEGKSFSPEDMEFLEKIMPVDRVKEVYTPGFTDPYKFDEQFNDTFLNENAGQFLTVWSHGLTQYFGEYVEAYLHQTAGYWHYGESNSVCTQGISKNNLEIEQIDIIENVIGISLEPIFEKLVLAGRKAPILCVLSSMAMQMFMIMILYLQYLRSKNGKQALWLLPLALLWATIMVATPAYCLLRYLFPLFLLWPFMIAEFLKCNPLPKERH